MTGIATGEVAAAAIMGADLAEGGAGFCAVFASSPPFDRLVCVIALPDGDEIRRRLHRLEMIHQAKRAITPTCRRIATVIAETLALVSFFRPSPGKPTGIASPTRAGPGWRTPAGNLRREAPPHASPERLAGRRAARR
ncbi:MAG: hypothetical protein R3F11_17325 [Verrucomicrobiales bacterium]